MARLLLVSNRLPVTVRQEGAHVLVTPSAGGLATGLAGPHRELEGLWIGWPGDTSRLSVPQLADVSERLAQLRCVPIYLSASEISRYYDGFANRVLWPVFHYLVDRLPLQTRDWTAYQNVNTRFADEVARLYRPGDLIWVHDYQLLLLPGLLRERLPEARIGFFLHIPFPSPEVFRILPWRRELLIGMLGADLVGFHTASYTRHFAQALEELLDLRADDTVRWAGREVRLGAFPIGIDVEGFESRARSPEVERLVQEIRGQAAGRRILLGVDRLDYTKGLRRRLTAVERLLARWPALRGKLRFIQVAVPSRTNVDTYAAFRREVDEVVGRINGSYGTPTSVPIHYMFRGLPAAQLSALYRAAEVMLVTPLRDGMNLVAKEYVASRVDEDGVLILSEFAGAAAELSRALLVNPYDVEGMASTIDRALRLSPEEQRRRMRALRTAVRGNSAERWAQSFLAALERSRAESRSFAPGSLQHELEALTRALAEAPGRLLLLDYDGTLVPLAPSPELALPNPRLRQLLRQLAQLPGTAVHLVSGRTRENLGALLGDLPVCLHAEHGLWSRTPDGAWERANVPDAPWLADVAEIIQDFVARVPGSRRELKSACVGWHYRQAPPLMAREALGDLRDALTARLSDSAAELLQGDQVLEVRPLGLHKGLVVEQVLRTRDPGTRVFAAGDDRTDEDLFRALPPDGIALHVGPRPSRARYRLDSPDELLSLLERVAQMARAAQPLERPPPSTP